MAPVFWLIMAWDSAALAFFFCLDFMNQMPNAIRARTATPPTTPPTMGPMGVEPPPPLFGTGVDVAEVVVGGAELLLSVLDEEERRVKVLWAPYTMVVSI